MDGPRSKIESGERNSIPLLNAEVFDAILTNCIYPPDDSSIGDIHVQSWPP
jgi:hypothetical protein